MLAINMTKTKAHTLRTKQCCEHLTCIIHKAKLLCYRKAAQHDRIELQQHKRSEGLSAPSP
jgi:hypothetical protein